MSLAQERLYEAVEKGLLPADDTLRVRAHKAQARRQEILLEVARKRDRGQIALTELSPKQITTFCAALRDRLLDPDTGFGKAYVNLLVDEIRLEGNELTCAAATTRSRGWSVSERRRSWNECPASYLNGVPTGS